MKVGDKVAWRFRDRKHASMFPISFNEYWVREINGSLVKMADSKGGKGSWFKIGEVEIIVVDEERAKEKACKDGYHIIDGTGLKCFCGRIDLPMTIPEAFRKPGAKVML